MRGICPSEGHVVVHSRLDLLRQRGFDAGGPLTVAVSDRLDVVFVVGTDDPQNCRPHVLDFSSGVSAGCTSTRVGFVSCKYVFVDLR